ncbi:Deoxynucleoside triphosphate triphosphohydrolase SAMHD1 [Grifola frondosa]|uniref:Deoxynucleoside triphosphate triphosphohydrolase SAMHD1 n=1 Tax=Grifola frondosa TaxID=5627 RepID=A0A1C7M4Z7_GRIFR|nr:Deoxynucleoside triphosphate triphosphohydrolase SAMHD1 [Grifola frondosa]
MTRLLDMEEDIDSPEYRKTIRRFKDSIHDYMGFGPTVCAIIDTPQFQRLRYIKQLGTSYHVWPCASHNRFEHSLGVAHLAQTMVLNLKNTQPTLGITDRDVRCVTIAGLCHDLGHGPWSHVWDSLFIPRALPGRNWTHEEASEMMFDSLLKENELELDDQDANFIKALIASDPSRCSGTEKPYLFEIVANKRNSLDVDKFDYIARDSHAIDQKSNLSLTTICYDIKDANQIYELCHTRFSLHKRIYSHKTAKAIEHMIVDALLLADKYLHIAERINDPRNFYQDDEFHNQLEKARRIFHRINTRDLYKAVDFKVILWNEMDICRDYFTPANIVRAAKSLFESGTKERTGAEEIDFTSVNMQDVEDLSEDHVIVDMAPRHFGMEDKNPLEYVKFYSKHHPDEAKLANLDDISLSMPQVFGEALLRVYTREPRFFGLVQAGYRELGVKFHEEMFPYTSRTVSPEPQLLIPPDSKAPSTPRPTTRSLTRVPSGLTFRKAEEYET